MNSVYNNLFSNETPPLFSKSKVFLTSEVLGTALLVAEAFNKKKDNYVIIANNLYNAQKIISSLQTFVKREDILFYPNDDFLFTEVISATKELEAQRLYTLYKSGAINDKYIYVTNLSAALTGVLTPDSFRAHIKTLKVGNTLKMSALINNLVALGYQRVTNVEQTMQFATRGDIVDFFSVTEDNPTRVEFFDDEIESMRTFNIGSQVSFTKIEEVTIIPAHESILSEGERKAFIKGLYETLQATTKGMDNSEIELFRDELEQRISLSADGNRLTLQKYRLTSPLFAHSLLDYITCPKVVFANHPQLKASYDILKDQEEHFVKNEVKKHVLLPDTKLYRDDFILKRYEYWSTTEFSEDGSEYDFPITIVPNIRSKEDFGQVVKKYYEEDKKIYFALNNNVQLEQIKQLITDLELSFSLEQENKDTPVIITFDYYPQGFTLKTANITLFTSKELFNITRNEMRYNARFKAGTVIRNYEQLTPGDFVVHEYHGIGQYLEIESMMAFGVIKDYIKLKYANDEKLAVPLEQIHLIRKYSGREGVSPRLHNLGGQAWNTTKARIHEKINDIADKLIKIQASRYQTEGYQFPLDDEFQKEFELGFPYELTEDQEIALREIKQDMEKPQVMDRLLSGDVGFGKTEIALRAAFKAISAGKQVLFLCPTTLLARQHFEVATNRFMNFGVKIGLVSRLVTTKEKNTTLAEFSEGKVHLLIGTHALLNISFEESNVGLLIVDEEQRFGVEQKETIKKMKVRVDVLTLSATPIPRTLQMSLVGLRSLSQINTAPQERMPIQTFVIKKDDYVVKELIERELLRDGQVFYLHNRIASIYSVANKISRLVPAAQIGVIHGQMDRNEIEAIMTSFYNNEINVLVATSIIENGIDVPNANVMIIENADHFGLSQLYQIKGRVGRGNRIAYAYLLYQPQKVMNDDARKRLQAIQEFTDLGSGYKIAERDLMIRGAGDILGAEQSGFIDSVGIDMYLKMLQDALNNKKYNLQSEPIERNINISGLEAYIPDSFASKVDKFDLYLEIKQCKKLTTLKVLEEKVIDMYGKLPRAIEIIFIKRQIELMVNSRVGYVEEVIDENSYIDVLPGTGFLNISGAATILNSRMGSRYTNIRLITQNGKIKIRIMKKGEWFAAYATVVRTIVAIVRETIREKHET